MDRQNVYERIKAARLQRYLTNCYSMDVVANCMDVWSCDDEFVFSYEDHGIQRLVYFVKKMDSVDQLLERIPEGRYYLEFMTNNPGYYTPHSAGLTASMMRMSNPDCRSIFNSNSLLMQYKNAVEIEIANAQDTKEINGILWSTFRTEVSHLLSDKELKQKIETKQITIHRNNDNEIDALLQADIMPKKFYINQIVNRTEKRVIHAILLNRLEEYIKAGGKYMYAWVEDKNVASVKFHEKYGMKHDGMWSMIYSIER